MRTRTAAIRCVHSRRFFPSWASDGFGVPTVWTRHVARHTCAPGKGRQQGAQPPQRQSLNDRGGMHTHACVYAKQQGLSCTAACRCVRDTQDLPAAAQTLATGVSRQHAVCLSHCCCLGGTRTCVVEEGQWCACTTRRRTSDACRPMLLWSTSTPASREHAGGRSRAAVPVCIPQHRASFQLM